MHDGFKVIRFDLSLGEKEISGGSILKRYDEHKSLAYGVDWSSAESFSSSNGETAIGCCSFYDHKMSIWSA